MLEWLGGWVPQLPSCPPNLLLLESNPTGPRGTALPPAHPLPPCPRTLLWPGVAQQLGLQRRGPGHRIRQVAEGERELPRLWLLAFVAPGEGEWVCGVGGGRGDQRQAAEGEGERVSGTSVPLAAPRPTHRPGAPGRAPVLAQQLAHDLGSLGDGQVVGGEHPGRRGGWVKEVGGVGR